MSLCSANSDSEIETTTSAKSRSTRMTTVERDAMIDWLDMEREGQKESQGMKNWRSIWGGAAKGRGMQGDVDEVHAAGGYAKLAAYVNSKCQIKSDKSRAWTSEIAKKRWAWVKKQYKAATRIVKPINTTFENEEEFEAELAKHAQDQEKVCPCFKKLDAMLHAHPAIQPHGTVDSLTLNSKGDNGEDNDGSEADMLSSSNTLGVVRKRKDGEDGNSTTTKKKMQQKEPFSLRKPEAESTRRLNIHEMFMKTQEKQADVDRQKLLVQAVSELAKAGVSADAMAPYLSLMGLKTPKPASNGSDEP